MKQFNFILIALLAVALTSVSCLKEFDPNKGQWNTPGSIPADFEWSLTRSVAATVGMPTVDGVAPSYAIIRIYISPVITEGTEVAMGVVSSANPSFNSVFTMPTGVNEVYVQTTLPDGRSSVRSAEVTGERFSMSGAVMPKVASIPAYTLQAAPADRKSSSMPTDYPKVAMKTSFPANVTISKTPSKMYDLGADYVKWDEGCAVANEYFIPAGAVITDNINLNGGQSPYPNPVLYVAGTLTLSQAQVGGVTLAVLPGGVVNITRELRASNVNKTQPAIYIFEGGSLKVKSANLSCRYVVNEGTFAVEDKLDLNGQLSFYNVAGAALEAKDLIYSNTRGLHSDGKVTVNTLELNSSTEFVNYENGEVNIEDFKLPNGGTTFVQKGQAKIGDMLVQGKFYVNCYTYVEELKSEGGQIFLASDACLETEDTEFNNVKFDMAAGSLFIAREYNQDDNTGNGNTFKNNKSGIAVVRFEEKAICRQGKSTQFAGPIEVVYDDSKLDEKYQIDEKYVKNHFKGAYLTPKQKTDIADSDCNAGKGSIIPEPVPEPDYVEIEGKPFTLCFEDTWPWMGDYDLNDLVVVTSVDRRMTKEGDKVEFIRINWEVKASGAFHRLALGVQLDKVLSAQVASVETNNTSFGAGPFAGAGLEAGSDYAVIPLFNSVKETQDAGVINFNTNKTGLTVATRKFTTKVTFTQVVDAAKVLESELNMFIVVNQGQNGVVKRTTEIHLPGYKPTVFGDISGEKSILPESPFKYYAPKDPVNNGMMWGLLIPGNFRYPIETNDIRKVYKTFRVWALSGGATDTEWYLGEVDDTKLY